MIDVASKAGIGWLYNFSELLLFGKKYFCLLVPEIGMAHLIFDFFSMNKGKRYMPRTGTFYSYLAPEKTKAKRRRNLKGHIF